MPQTFCTNLPRSGERVTLETFLYSVEIATLECTSTAFLSLEIDFVYSRLSKHEKFFASQTPCNDIKVVGTNL